MQVQQLEQPKLIRTKLQLNNKRISDILKETRVEQCYNAFSNHDVEDAGAKHDIPLPEDIKFCALGAIRHYFGWDGNMYDTTGMEEIKQIPQGIQQLIISLNDDLKLEINNIGETMAELGY